MRANKPANYVTFAHGCGLFTTKPENAQRVRDSLDALARSVTKKPKVPSANNIAYPKFTPGMTTGDYINEFRMLNYKSRSESHTFIHIERPAPMLDPREPEVLEEPDPDYVAPVKTRKASNARELAALVRDALQFAPPEWQARALEVL